MTDKPPTEADLLADLADTYRRRQDLDRQRDDVFAKEVALVAELRQMSTTWQRIADLLGRAKSNTITTYRPHLVETRTVRPKPKEAP
ncbi:hypothetical protein [Verrucosispora sp. NA02020]|uniref:hypothetical protein n=1 Tax=Verrucosispora sp. NA02020 TaxID=2742132 RepID=UPI0015906C82|nr:hypothetical protein [Verrucosispora sp. NA02020]QKW15416.1 hypothetical protein HUT12_23390 [Verrucosispora sp. NA02020]